MIASDSLVSINDKKVTNNSRMFIRNKIKVKGSRRVETDIIETVSTKPIPHLPPYATQYR